jgi:hypothetical protein
MGPSILLNGKYAPKPSQAQTPRCLKSVWIFKICLARVEPSNPTKPMARSINHDQGVTSRRVMESIRVPSGATRREMRIILGTTDNEYWRFDAAEIHVEKWKARCMLARKVSATSPGRRQQDPGLDARVRKIFAI